MADSVLAREGGRGHGTANVAVRGERDSVGMWAPGRVHWFPGRVRGRAAGRPAARAGRRGVGQWDEDAWEEWAATRAELMGRDQGAGVAFAPGDPSVSALGGGEGAVGGVLGALPDHWKEEARQWGPGGTRERPRRGRPRGKKDAGEMAEYVSGHTATYLRLARRVKAWRTSFGLAHGRDPTVDDMSQDVVRLHVAMFTVGDILRSRED